MRIMHHNRTLFSTKLWLFLAFLLILPVFFFPNSSSVIPLSSPLYNLLDNLSLAVGVVQPSSVRPWTVQQARYYVDSYRARGIAPWALPLLQQAEVLLGDFDRPQVPFLDLQFSPEFYGRTNQDLPFTRGYVQREPIINMIGGIYLNDILAIEGDFGLPLDPMVTNNPEVGSNFQRDFSYYDVQLPHRAYLSLAGPHWSVFLGRDQAQVGIGQHSQLVISDSPHYLDRFQANLYWDTFRYTFLLAYFEPWLTPAESAANSGFWNPPAVPLADAEASKYFAMHRFDFTPLPWLTASLTEGLMYGGKYPDLRLLNPLQIYHSFYEWRHSASLFSAELSLTPVRGLGVYGQFMFNQIQSAYEIERYGADAIPNARGWRAGVTGNTGLGPGFIEGVFEYTHTDPWLYIRENPLLTYSWRRKVLSNTLGANPLLTEPLGFVHGPDSSSFWAGVHYSLVGLGFVRLEAEHLRRGERRITDPYDEGPGPAADRTPSGNFDTQVTLGFHLGGRVLDFLHPSLGLVYTRLKPFEGQTVSGTEWYAGLSLGIRDLLDFIQR